MIRWSFTLILATAASAAAVEHATIAVDGAGVPTVSGGSAGFFLDPGQVTGEFPVRIGADASDDASGGVLLNSVSDLVRDGLYATGSTVRDSSSNSGNTRGLAGGLAISSTKAGAASPADAGLPINSDLSAAYFPFSQGWSAGSLYSSTVNANGTFGDLDTLVASAGIGLGTEITTNILGQTGVHKVTIPGVTDANRQGILVASTASNVGRFTTVAPGLDGDGYIVRSIDNDGFFEFDPDSDPSMTGEADGVVTPFSFAFVPVGTPGVTFARVATNGSTLVEGEQVGIPMVHSGADFTVTSNNLTGPGQFRLEINGVTPADGTLILTPVGSSEDPGGRASDNVITYEADATGWNILSQDMEADHLYNADVDLSPLDGSGQAANGPDTYFNFLFVPNTGAPTVAPAIPAAETLTSFNKSRIIAFNVEITSLSADNGNDPGDVGAFVAGGGTEKTSDVRIDLFANRGDVNVAVDGAHLDINDGLLLTTINQGFRDNTASGGAAEYGVTMTTAFDQEWSVVTASADDISGSDEHNINFAAAFFGADSGFQMAINDDIEGAFGDPYDTTKLDVDLPSVNSLTDGVLMASPFGNDDNYASAEPKADGSGWEIRVFDNTFDATIDGRVEPDAASWIYLPYSTENLIAGLVDDDGTVVSSTAAEGEAWTLTKENDTFGFPQYRLSFTDPELGPEDGMLLLTGTGDFEGLENRDNSMLYEVDGDDFLIRGIDHVDNSEADAFVDFVDVGFMFAYIDFDNPVIAPGLAGDYNGDGLVDAADFTVWRDSLGGDASSLAPGSRDPSLAGVISVDDYLWWKQSFTPSVAGSAAAAAAPEPGSVVGVLAALSLAALRRRRGTSK